MPADPSPELFVIESVPQSADEPEEENFIIRTALSDGQWTVSPIEMKGTYDVRWFLNDKGIDEKRIAHAIAELTRGKRVRVSQRFLNAS